MAETPRLVRASRDLASRGGRTGWVAGWFAGRFPIFCAAVVGFTLSLSGGATTSAQSVAMLSPSKLPSSNAPSNSGRASESAGRPRSVGAPSVGAPSSSIGKLPPAEVTLARLEARRAPAATRPNVPLLLLSARAKRDQERAELDSRSLQKRRVDARYSMLALSEIPIPESLHEVTRAESRSPQLVPGVDQWADAHWLSSRSVESVDVDAFSADLGFYHQDLVAPNVEPLSVRERGLMRLARKLTFRNARKQMRARLKERLDEDPTYRFEDHQHDRDLVWTLGSGDDRNESQAYEEFRRGVLADDPEEVEREINLVEWGPIQIDDGGGLSIDIKRLFRRTEAAPTVELAAASEEKYEGVSLFSGRSYSLDTDFRFTPHVDELARGEFREFFGKIKTSVEIDFKDPILLDTYLSTELEAQFKTNGDVTVFLNFVLQ